MSDIAGSVGLDKSTLYNYVESKQELLDAVVRGLQEDGLAFVHRSASAATHPVDELRAIVRAHASFVAEHAETFDILARELAALEPRRRSAIAALRTEYEAYLADVIRRGQADKSFTATLDPALAAQVLRRMLNALHDSDPPLSDGVDEVCAAAEALVFKGLLAR